MPLISRQKDTHLDSQARCTTSQPRTLLSIVYLSRKCGQQRRAKDVTMLSRLRRKQAGDDEAGKKEKQRPFLEQSTIYFSLVGFLHT